MVPFKASIRSYGWYCSNCCEHKSANNITVAKIPSKSNDDMNYIGVVCSRCKTELNNCFDVKKIIPEINDWCATCEDRFQCFTKSEAQTDKDLTNVHSQEIRPSRLGDVGTEEVCGIQSYTGRIHDKLESGDYCEFQEREDCNFSWMRLYYKGEPYSRCRNMNYDRTNKQWYCLYGKEKRGLI
jgi:hypothetical protein